jgi:hypothetical protein
MKGGLTAAQVAERLEVGRSTVNLWCRQGLLAGARREDSPVGPYWLIPESALKTFSRPKRGPTPKTKSEGDKQKQPRKNRKTSIP